MISPKAIEAYLDRKLSNYDWMKKAPVEELDEAIRDINPRPRFKGIQFWMHQKVCFLLMVTLKRFMLFLDMGGGKTLLCLMFLRWLKQNGKQPRAIVFVPYITAVNTWIEEVEKHTPELICVPLLGTGKENRAALKGEGDLFVGTYQTVTALLSKTVSTKSGKNRWNFKAADVRKVFKDFDLLIMDEVHKIKSLDSLYYRMCRAISQVTDYAFGLTGTPFGKEPLDLWTQFYVLDFGETLGETLGLFREVFYSSKPGFWGGTKYKFKKKLMRDLKRMVKNRSIRYEITECHDMPKRRTIQKKVTPPKGIIGYYNTAVDKIEKLRKSGAPRGEMKATWIQLAQLSSGFMTLKGEDNDKVHITLDENPKLEVLEGLIDSLPEGRKMIVFHNFVYTNELISAHLKKLKVNHARVYGKTKDPIAEIRRFKNDPSCTVLVCNTAAGSSSQNLQCANYVVFFEQPMSAIDRQQAERRAWRPGQEMPVWFYDIIMTGTRDEAQRRSNKAGRDLLRDVLDGSERLRKLAA